MRDLSSLPENFGNLPALKTLVLHELPLLRLPASFTRLTSLEAFFLVCEGMGELHGGGLASLQTLCLTQFSQDKLPSTFTQLASLTRLQLDECDFVELPTGMAEMTNLQELCIRECQALKELSEFLTALVSLRVPRIEGCDELSSVPKRLDNLTRLKQLELRRCELLTEVPQSLPLSLRALSYNGNQQLVSWPGVSTLTDLKKLRLGTVSATCLEAISSRLNGLEHLELALGDEDDAKESLSALTRLSRLRTLTLHGARSIKKLVGFDGSALQELRQLNIHTGRDEFTELPAAITALHHLTSIRIEAHNLSSIPDAIGALSRLHKLNLSDCFSLTLLPASLTQLSCLHELNLSCTSIQLLPAGFTQLSRLKNLKLGNCRQLQALPDDIRDLPMLDFLDTMGFYMLQR
ncbi:unnamed protein product [Closterium sp. Yama58-4]|nr:unnamed protein product [Closterium sp. Yama58-4]